MTLDDQDVLAFGLNQIVKGAGITFFGMISGRVLVFAAKLIIGNKLGPDEFGIFNIGLSFIVILTFVTLGGIYEGVPSFVSNYRAKEEWRAIKDVLFTSVTFVLLSGVLAGGVVFVFSRTISVDLFHDERYVPVFKIAAIGFPLFALAQVLLSCLRGFKSMKGMVISRNLCGDMGLVLGLLLVSLFGFSLLTGLGCFLVKYTLIIIVATYFLVRHHLRSLSGFFQSYRARISWSLLRFSIPLTGALAFETVTLYMETLLLGYFISSDAVGLFSSAFILASLLLIVGACFRAILLPVIAEMIAGNKGEAVQKVYQSVNKWIIFILAPPLMLLVFFPGVIVSLFFGSAYEEAYFAFQILGVSYFIHTWAGNWSVLVYALQKPKIDLWVKLVGMIASIGLNLTLIPALGLTGAVFAHGGALILMDVLGMIVMHRHIGSFLPVRNVARVVSLSFVFVLAFYFVARDTLLANTSWFLTMILFGGVVIPNYVLAVKLVGMDSYERMIMDRMRWRLLPKFLR